MPAPLRLAQSVCLCFLLPPLLPHKWPRRLGRLLLVWALLLLRLVLLAVMWLLWVLFPDASLLLSYRLCIINRVPRCPGVMGEGWQHEQVIEGSCSIGSACL
jgi:hypothetical protein